MKMKMISWESEGLRCPDIKVDLELGGKCPRVFLIQMPNGTGKTTTLTMIHAALTGEAVDWDFEKINKLRRSGDSNQSGKFILKLKIDDKPLTFEIQLDFVEGIAKYRTTTTGSGGVVPNWSPPTEIQRYLKQQFVYLFVFDGELAQRLLDAEKSEAENAIDALCQLYLMDEVSSFSEWDWSRVTKKPGPKGQTGLNAAKLKEEVLDKQLKKVRRIREGAVAEIATLTKKMKELDDAIGAKIKQIEGDQEKHQKLKDDERERESIVDKDSLKLMMEIRKPHLLHPDLREALRTLKVKLDKAKLPESSSRQFFTELSQEPICVCGRPIGEHERKAIIELAGKYLGEDIAGVLNALKRDIDLHITNDDNNSSTLVQTLADDLKRDVNLWHQSRATREAHESELLRRGGEKVQEQRESLLKYGSAKADLEALLEDEIDRLPTLTDDEKTQCIASLDRQLREIRARIAEISDTVELRKKTDVIKEILARAKVVSRESLRDVLIKECNQRLEKVLSRDPVRIENISRSLVLRNQEGASVGQTLAVGYTFITSLLHRGQHNFPLIVDSPANPIDNNVRREIGALIPELCDQFVAFTISSEREGFVSALEKSAHGDIRYVTMFRATEGTKNLLKEMPSTGVLKSENAVLIEGRDYFFKFDVDDENEGR